MKVRSKYFPKHDSAPCIMHHSELIRIGDYDQSLALVDITVGLGNGGTSMYISF